MAVMTAVTFLLKQRGVDTQPVFTSQQSELRAFLGEDRLGLLACDVTAEGMLAMLEQLRSCNPDMKLVLLADKTVAPVAYIRPSILPTALLWRPVERETTRQVMREVLDTMPQEHSEEADAVDEVFSIEVRGVVRVFPYRDILLFESREKRLYLHLRRKEVPFPGTLERLMETLPEEFIRVHKSVIVNRIKIVEIQFGQNTLILEGGISIPISRSYKPQLKAVFS